MLKDEQSGTPLISPFTRQILIVLHTTSLSVCYALAMLSSPPNQLQPSH